MPGRPAVRLAFFYGSVFAGIGIFLPFWPVWLADARGLSAGEIGVILAAGFWPRVVISIAIGWAADRWGERKRPMIALAAATLALVALYTLAEGFWALLVLSLLVGATYASIVPLGEALALQEAKAAGFGYGRVRLWGSITFIAASIGIGTALERSGAEVVLQGLVATLGLTLLACALLPDTRVPLRGEPPARLGALLRRPGFLAFLLASGLIHGSHAVYYGFATIHWRDAGHGETLIGWLWALGVLAEILLFAWGGQVLARIGALRLLVLAGALTAVRWGVMALGTELWLLVPAQVLHAASFGAAYLAGMHHLRDGTPPEMHATAQGCFAAAVALLFGVLTPAAGWLYGALAGAAFWPMALLAATGTALVARMSSLRAAAA